MRPPRRQAGITLLELLVVICVISILAALIFQVVSSAREAGRKAACISNLRQIGGAIMSYAGENEGKIPYGPKAPPFTNPAELYPSTGAPTTLISLRYGPPVGLGLLLDRYLEKTPQVLFCPGCDDHVDAKTELAKVGTTQAQGGYYYRHGGNTQIFDSPGMPESDHLRLASLGDNRNGKPIRALVIDAIFRCPPGLSQFNVIPRSNHGGKFANVLYADGHVASLDNQDEQFSVDVKDYSQLRSSFDKILRVFERADEQ